jgi:hypothetical protein
MPPYVAGPHPRVDKFVPRHFSDGFGQLPFVYGNPPANQLDGFFLIGFVHKKIPHDSRFSLGIESRDPDVPSCWHSWDYAPQLSWVNGFLNQAGLLPALDPTIALPGGILVRGVGLRVFGFALGALGWTGRGGAGQGPGQQRGANDPAQFRTIQVCPKDLLTLPPAG